MGEIWSKWTVEHGIRVGDKVTIGGLSEVELRAYRKCGFTIRGGEVECVITRVGVAPAGKSSKAAATPEQ